MPLVRCFIMQVLKRYIIGDEERKSIIKNISDFLDNEGAEGEVIVEVIGSNLHLLHFCAC